MTPLYLDIAAQISAHLGVPFRPRQAQARGGGCISEGMVLDDGVQRYFVKLNRAANLPMFAAEAAALEHLASTHTLRVPQPIVHGQIGTQAFLVLEYLPLVDHDDPARLGEQLAALHRHSAPHFGFQHDNFIGSTPQCNTAQQDWIRFWSQYRLQPQLERAQTGGMDSATLDLGTRLLDVLPQFFTDYTPQPSLLHGDLWGGNYGYMQDGSSIVPVIFDPATYYGDRETDLAMTELFGGFPPRFRHAYEAAWPLDVGFAVRRTLYNLYHILNHFNLFGAGYAAQARRMIERLLSEVAA